MDKELVKAIEEVFEDFCPDGNDCPVHHRVDRMFLEEETLYGSAITYVGKYVVMTGDNYSLSPFEILQVALNPNANVDPYEVSVIEVGNGTLDDVRKAANGKKKDTFTRHLHSFRNWEDFVSEHEAMVQRVRKGSVDLTGFFGK